MDCKMLTRDHLMLDAHKHYYAAMAINTVLSIYIQHLMNNANEWALSEVHYIKRLQCRE